jgi:methylated-DNA-[protein]-cysteine S-methyltransferase
MTFYTYVESPLGQILLTSDGSSLSGLYLEGQRYEPTPTSDWTQTGGSPLFSSAATQLAEYFAGSRTHFQLPLAPLGTPFQQEVWRRLKDIPYGTRVSYGAIAQAMGTPQSARAVGAAVGRNPLSIIIPCHRVVGKDGALTGYAGGIERKQTLLTLEERSLPDCP